MYHIPLNQWNFARCQYVLCRFLKSFHKSFCISLIPKSFSFCIITPSFRFILNFYGDISQNQCSILLHHLGQKCAAAFKFLIQRFPPSLVASASHQNNSDNSFLDDTTTLRKRQYLQFKKFGSHIPEACYQLISFIDFSWCPLQNTHFVYPYQNASC